ncbi:hypothetical protein ABB37_09241 [Leptomonas pyrrhocoris]|uniref:Uncharacterized protein n=1 Tax=Leptomonas pyrrhocoris TaxID=157538 RepID=A0A0M9FR34_LEPPY|nr:hypothetical protein ABB37_09241 [Leptomonas pyrrhocoris]KPA74219.1 hypothetical protein ABB37_09241 [Leptomonas pyrrhocoris]|eukprot:XP_015652658.1 hypothetical protein ABB37_09241 [Leptomonas pyrrhocoris]
MQQMVITYVLSGLANIADVNPRDVHTSIFNGNIRVNHVSLRPETMNKLLPLPMEEGTVPEMEVQIPNPSTSAPMDVKVRRARILLQFDLTSPPAARTPEQVLHGVTATSILGHAAADPAEASSEPVSPLDDRENEAANFDFSSAASDVEEEDFKSCAGDGDFSDNESLSDSDSFGSPTSFDDAEGAEAQGGSWFGYLRSRAAQSVAWIWRRQIRIAFTDLTIVLPCDTRKNIHYEIAVDSFTVVVEPTQTTGAEQMKIVNIKIGGANVFASAGDARSRILVVEALSVTITTVYEANTERELRKNVSVSFDGTNTIVADEATLFALLKCHLSREARLAVPPYCLPFASLRARGSLWPYAKACVIQGLRDYRQRFNFNASYLRFYAQARERYVQLLNECHRGQSVAERRRQLAEAEQDLRHEDVILFLRRHVQRKYNGVVAEQDGDEAAEVEPLIVSSTHIMWKVVKVVLPARNTVFASDTALILRNEETVFTVRAISLDSDGAVQAVTAPLSAAEATAESPTVNLTEETSLLYVHITDAASSQRAKVSLQPLALRGSLDGALRCVTPIADALQRVGAQARTSATTPMSQPTAASQNPSPPAPAAKVATTILAVRSLKIQLDDFELLVDRLSCTTASAPGVPTKLGCTMRTCHLKHAESYVLAPVEVRMTPRGNVVVSRVSLLVSRETWAGLRKDADSLRLLYEKYPRFSGAASAPSVSSAAPAVSIASANIDLLALKGLQRVLQWSAVSSCPPMEVDDVAMEFQPLDATVAIQRISVQTVAAAPRGPFGAHVTLRRLTVQCSHTNRITLRVEMNGGVRVGLSPEPAQALVVAIPEMSVSGKRPKETEDISLLVLKGVEGVVHGTVQYYLTRHMLAANSVCIEDAELLYKTDPSVPMFNDRPCLTSYMQVAAEVTSVDMEKLSAVPTRAVSHVLGEVYTFACDEIISENYYRTFFSCFSDVALRISMHDCVVRCGSDERAEVLLVSMSNTTSEERLTALNVYQPHLQATADNFPILILNDVGRLSMEVDVSCVAVRVSARAAVSPSDVSLAVTRLKLQMALEKMPFWRAEAMEIPAVPQRWTVDNVRAVTRLDRHSATAASVFDASLSAFSMETATSVSWNTGSSLSLSMPRDLVPNPPESDRGSCASSADEEVDTTQVTLRRWSTAVDFSAALSDFYKLQHMIRAVVDAASCFSRRVVLAEDTTSTAFHLDDCGDVFLDSPTRLLLLQDCTFYAPSPDRHIVVCPGTSVVFRRCTFVRSLHTSLIRTSSRAALYACEDCRLSNGEGFTSPASPTGAAMPSLATPSPGSVAATLERRSTRTHVAVDEGCVTVQLDSVSRLVCVQKALSLTCKRKTRRTFVKLRNGELRMEYVDAVQRVPVLAKTIAEGEMAVLLPRRSCTVSCSISCGEMTIPVVTSKVRAVQDRVSVLTAASAASEPSSSSADAAAGELPSVAYVVPPPPPFSPDAASRSSPTPDRFPYDSWKVLLSLSLIPIAVQLPGGMKVAKVTLSNAFVWSKREPLAEAQVEARIALHDMALWEWQQQTFKSVVSSPVFLGVQGRTASPLNVNLTASVSPIDATVSTDQLRLLLHSVMAPSNDAAVPTTTTATSFGWHNYTGVTLRVRGGQGDVVSIPAATKPEEPTFVPTTVPCTITEVDDVVVDHVERDTALGTGLISTASFSTDRAAEALFLSRRVVVLADKRQLHLTATLTHDMTQTISVRTVVQIMNKTPFCLILAAASQREQVIAPFDLSCVPEAMLSCSDLSVAAAKSATNSPPRSTTLREPLFPDFTPASAFYQRCYQQGYPAADVPREFVSQLDGSSMFMVTEFVMHGPVLLLVFRAMRPHVVNDTVYPMQIDAVNTRDEVLAKEQVAAGGRAFFFGLPPTMNVRARVRLFVGEEVYEARDTVALFDREAAAVESTVVLVHTAYPRRYFFELNLSVAADGPAGSHGVALTTSYLCLVKNCTTANLFFSTEEGDAVGTMGTTGMPGSVDTGAIGYVPSNSVVCIKSKGAALSEPFEIDDSGEGCVIQCDRAPEPSAYSASYFLLHMVPNSRTKVAELLPSIVFRNRHRRRVLCVKHVIRHSGSTRALEETVLEISPQSSHCYYTLSKYGYTNDLLFAWKGESAAAEELTFSSVVETDLAPSTTWCGFVCCGATHHQVEIAKRHLYEPAYVTVGPAVLPRVRLVNLTNTNFREVESYQVAFPQPSKNNKYLLLTAAEGTMHTVDLLQEEPVELEPGVTVQVVRAEEDRCSVVLSNGRVFVTMEKSWVEEVQFSMNVQMTTLQMRLRDGSAVPLQLFWRSFAVNVTWWSGTTSLQSSVTGICLDIHYEGRRQQVIEPFDADVSVRELRSTTRDVYLKGFYIGLQPLTITVSDVLLYQLQVLSSRCKVDAPFQVSAWVRQRVATCILHSLPTQLPQLLHIGSAGISETPLELSWDRSARPPQDFLLGDSVISKLIPSLHHAMLVIPKLQLRNVSRVSLSELVRRIQQILVMEVVKQIPKMVTTVGLFKKNSSLFEKLTSTVSSLLFRPATETNTTDDGSSLLL